MDIDTIYQYYLSHPHITTDSRQVPENSLFFALKGENFNGNAFAANALKKGAIYAIIDEEKYQPKNDNRFILVNDVLKTLQRLATKHRSQFDIPFLAITGSNGKTTTKELVATTLQKKYKTYATKGNFNNHIGVPLTLLSIRKDVEIAVIEMGANHEGEIARLCEIAQPTFGLITNIGKAHLEGFGSLEGVKRAKGELFDYLREQNGTVFVNKDHPYLLDMAKGLNKITYSSVTNANCTGKVTAETPYLKVGTKNPDLTIKSQLVGRYNLENILAAVCVGHHFEVPAPSIEQAITNYHPTLNRSQIIKKNRNTYWMDAYNANPVSMQEAIENFTEASSNDNKIVILGDMLELGKFSKAEHKKIVELLKQKDIHQVILVGQEFKKVKDEIPCQHFDHVDDLKKWLKDQSFSNTSFLIKGSRGIGLEQIIE